MAKGRKQPRTVCPTCGVEISQQALKRHHGTVKCLEGYARRLLQPQHVMPTGRRVIWWNAKGALTKILRDAEITPEESPMQPCVVWGDDMDGPVMQWTVPTWLGIAMTGVTGLIMSQYNGAEGSARHRERRGDEKEAERYRAKLGPIKVRLDVAVNDIVTVLKAGLSDEEQLGLAAELHISAGDAEGDHCENKVREVMRRTASRLLGDGRE